MTVTADRGGSNGYRTRLWETELQALTGQTGLQIRVMHYPPDTSKWEQDRAAAAQLHLDQMARQATTQPRHLPTEIKGLTDDQVRAAQIEGEQLHPEWNYTVTPHQ